ncbi:unnamed protein product [Prunus armeniaca]|uniref:Uncharacterized protein n=1 Tax=Prunus armeniaca TaxID=36596 RepID=A0A6J5THX3_PRUAR|nr:unnamed protein product [Prunus armeniaca]
MENGIQGSTRDHTLVRIVDGGIGLEALEKTMSKKLCPRSPSWAAKCCIFRVPPVLKRHKPDAYEPDFISIGPFHRGGKQFQHMENVKQWYLNNLLSRRNLSLKHLIDHIVELEQSAREFYAEPLDHLSQNDMVEMMILDGCFLIELFRKYQSHQEDVNDPIFRMDCMFQYLCHDLLLLENQLPWFVLQHLYHLTLDPYKSSPSLTVLMLTAFTSQKPLKHNCDSYLGPQKRKEKEAKEKKKNVCRPKRRRRRKSNDQLDTDMDSEFPPATALSEAGVKFQSNTKAGSIMNIEFEKGVFCYFGYKRGTFEIPHLSIGELTDPLFRNLIAFEQCYHHHSHEITSYAFLMDKLIASSKDMEFLCDKRIIDNWLSAEDGAKYFSKLCNDTVLKKFYYEALCEEVNMHYKVKWYRWLEKLNRDYFANPWSVISLIAAAILLALTVVQTVYTIRG